MSVFRRRRDMVSARNVEAYHSAAAAVLLRTYDQAERVRAELGPVHPWLAAEAVRLRLLAIWAVQTCFVAADAVFVASRRDGAAGDELPARVASLLESLYRLGNGLVPWLEQLLAAEPSFQPSARPALPVRLAGQSGVAAPHEVAVDESTVQAAATLVEALTAQVDLAWNDLEAGRPVPREMRPWAASIGQRYRGVRTVADQQRELWLGRPEGALRLEVHAQLERLGDELFRLGQGMLQPSLFDRTFTLRADRAVRAGDAAVTRDQRMIEALGRWLGFDPWLLTAPERRANAGGDVARQLDEFWRRDPDPQATRRVYERVLAAVAGGSLLRRGDETLRECPWSPVYVAKATVHVGERLAGGTVFAFRPGIVGGIFTHQFVRLGTDPAYHAPGHRHAGEPTGSQPRGPGPAGSSPTVAGGSPPADPWFFTDPQVRDRRAADPGALAQLARLWAADDDPERTRALAAQVAEAERVAATRRRPRKAWGFCPWPPTFVALRRVSIGGENIRAGEVFAVTVEAGPGEFVRRIVRIGRQDVG